MRDTARTVKVGALVVLILGASYVVYRLVDETSSAGDDYGVYALFTDARGLVRKSRVLMAGIPVGYIEDIRLEGQMARVDIRIDEDVPLHEDATVSKESASILGEAILVLNPGDPTLDQVDDGDQIAVLEPPPSTDDILRSVGQTARSVERIAAQVERVFGTDQGGDQMSDALRNLSEALEAINRSIQQNEAVIAATLENLEETTSVAGPEIIAILEDVRAVASDVRHIIGDNRDGLTSAGADVGETAATINRAAASLERAMEDIEEVTDRTARGEGTIGRLTNDEDLIDEVEGVVQGVGDIVGPMNRLQTIVGLRSEYNFLANTFKNYVSLYLQPREDRYYLIELIDDPRGSTEFVQTTVRRSPPAEGEPASYQETRIETREAFRFSLLFGKRVYFATFRFGLIESTGGIGVDIHLFDDNLEIATDLFAFGEQAFPRLRTRIAYEVVQRLWILGGIDDTLNDSRDFFLGAMLRFNDEDLKSILPFAGGIGTGG